MTDLATIPKCTTVQYAAQALGMSPGAVRGLLATGYLKGQKVDRVWQVSVESLQVLQALLRVPMRISAQLPSSKEQKAISAGLCPVCVGKRWAPAREGSNWSNEFMECEDCAFSIHSSFLEEHLEEQLRQRVRDHLERLIGLVRNGEAARECLQRRAQTLFPIEP